MINKNCEFCVALQKLDEGIFTNDEIRENHEHGHRPNQDWLTGQQMEFDKTEAYLRRIGEWN